MSTSIDLIVAQIIELSLQNNTGDEVRNIYSVLMEVSLKVGDIMRLIKEQSKLCQT
uniref:Uncharacterized protein n=1 Tax=viral metagenome TaxID=1070528 RepID=A0A6M3KFI9_9ZZZZ